LPQQKEEKEEEEEEEEEGACVQQMAMINDTSRSKTSYRQE
jgi:hypothetical protein